VRVQQFFTNFGFLAYKCRSRYARKPIRGSKDSDDNLVSKKILSQKIGSLVWRPGSGKIGQKDEKTPCDNPHSEPKTKIFFLFLTRRLAEPVDVLNSSLAESVGELWRRKFGQKCVSGGSFDRSAKYGIMQFPQTA